MPCDLHASIEDLAERVHELQRRVDNLEEQTAMMERDQQSLIFLCSVATVICMTMTLAILVI